MHIFARMTILPAEEKDISKIVALLKVSLGESLMPKSEPFWRWKHIENPFGKSPVLLAWEGDELIGVRAFMRWEWRMGDQTYRAVRAVDTATHPNHQGKGIFKKLTLELVEHCKSENIDFIFNTPNKKSKPGYLKMGWSSLGRTHLRLRPMLTFRGAALDFKVRHSMANADLRLPAIRGNANRERLTTNVSLAYLNWRYANNPNANYFVLTDGGDHPTYLLIFRLKKHRLATEFRICDSFFSDEIEWDGYRQHFNSVVAASGAMLLSSSARMNGGISVSVPLGPELTKLPIAIDDNYLTFNRWSPSLGDLEFF